MSLDWWLRRQKVEVRARVRTQVDRIEMGNFGNIMPLGAVSELRLDLGHGYRVYCERGGAFVVVLLGGADKRRQRRDIQQTEDYWHYYLKEQRNARDCV